MGLYATDNLTLLRTTKGGFEYEEDAVKVAKIEHIPKFRVEEVQRRRRACKMLREMEQENDRSMSGLPAVAPSELTRSHLLTLIQHLYFNA